MIFQQIMTWTFSVKFTCQLFHFYFLFLLIKINLSYSGFFFYLKMELTFCRNPHFTFELILAEIQLGLIFGCSPSHAESLSRWTSKHVGPSIKVPLPWIWIYGRGWIFFYNTVLLEYILLIIFSGQRSSDIQ